MPNEPHENGFRPRSKKPQIIISVAIISLVLVCFTLVNLHISRSSQTTSRDSIHIELPDSAENYDIQFSGRGNITHNGRRVEASDLRNSNASRRIIASTSGNLVIESDR